MKPLLSIFLLLSMVVCSFAVPPPLPDKLISVEKLPLSDSRLFASLQAVAFIASQPPDEVLNADKPLMRFLNLENAIGIVLLLLTTVFGVFWKKAIGKSKEAIALLTAFIAYIEDGKIDKTELADLKAKYMALKSPKK